MCDEHKPDQRGQRNMASRIEVNVEKTFDRGPTYGFLEVQVSFEEKAPTEKGMSFAQVMVALPKVEVGKMSFDQIRAAALSKALTFMEECLNSSRK
jgi:hypothetical protein